jgi:hypothetical protein
MHIRLLYRKAGKPMPADPYDFAPREQAKLALLIAINAKSHVSAARALADALRGDNSITDHFKTADRLLKAAKAKHPDIAWAIASDAGVRLMREDSELAERIMSETVRAIGIVPLAVHDSFMVPTSQEARLMETMERAISCGNNPTKNPCGNRGQFRDKLSRSDFSTFPENDPTIRDGIEIRDGCEAWVEGVGGLEEVERSGWDGRSGLVEMVFRIVHEQLDELEAKRNAVV